MSKVASGTAVPGEQEEYSPDIPHKHLPAVRYRERALSNNQANAAASGMPLPVRRRGPRGIAVATSTRSCWGEGSSDRYLARGTAGG